VSGYETVARVLATSLVNGDEDPKARYNSISPPVFLDDDVGIAEKEPNGFVIGTLGTEWKRMILQDATDRSWWQLHRRWGCIKVHCIGIFRNGRFEYANGSGGLSSFTINGKVLEEVLLISGLLIALVDPVISIRMIGTFLR